jgi:hypothetical protein
MFGELLGVHVKVTLCGVAVPVKLTPVDAAPLITITVAGGLNV